MVQRYRPEKMKENNKSLKKFLKNLNNFEKKYKIKIKFYLEVFFTRLEI